MKMWNNRDIKNRYKIGFDYLALIIFAVIMIPNIFSFLVPAKNDYLRIESATPVIDLSTYLCFS